MNPFAFGVSPFSPPPRGLPPSIGNGTWKDNLLLMLKTSHTKRGKTFNSLIDKVVDKPQASLDLPDMNRLICACMFHEEVVALSEILRQEHLQSLHVEPNEDEIADWNSEDLTVALQTLLKAMPDHWRASRLTLSRQCFAPQSCSLLFELLARMPELNSLRLISCNVARANSPLGLPGCPRLPKLENLRLSHMHEAFPLLKMILAASPQLRKLYLRSNTGFTREQHDSLALALKGHAKLNKLALRNLHPSPGGEALPSYANEFLAQHNTLTHLDVSDNALTPNACKSLTDALEDKGTLTSLSLAGCWPDGDSTVRATDLAMLVSLKSLVSLDLSRNQFPASMAPVLMALVNHPKLQHLSLDRAAMDGEFARVLAIVLESNKTLTSLQLPTMDDDLYAPLAEAMQNNQSLRSLSIRNVETQRRTMNAEDFSRRYPNYEALIERIARNQEHWTKRMLADSLAPTEGGMQAFLGHLGNVKPNHVPVDVARYAAQIALEMNGKDARVLALLDKSAQKKALEALERQ